LIKGFDHSRYKKIIPNLYLLTYALKVLLFLLKFKNLFYAKNWNYSYIDCLSFYGYLSVAYALISI